MGKTYINYYDKYPYMQYPASVMLMLCILYLLESICKKLD